MKTITLSLIFIINYGFSQTYQSNYVGAYRSESKILNINHKNEIYVGDLIKDIVTDNALFTYTMSIISNSNFSVIKVGIEYMNLPLKDKYETEIFFIENSKKIIYDLHKKNL